MTDAIVPLLNNGSSIRDLRLDEILKLLCDSQEKRNGNSVLFIYLITLTGTLGQCDTRCSILLFMSLRTRLN